MNSDPVKAELRRLLALSDFEASKNSFLRLAASSESGDRAALGDAIESLLISEPHYARERLITFCCAVYDTSGHTRRPLRHGTRLTTEGFSELMERERRQNKDPGYGGFLLPSLGVYAAVAGTDVAAKFRAALLQLIGETRPHPSGVRSRPDFGKLLCSGMLVLPPVLSMDQSGYVEPPSGE